MQPRRNYICSIGIIFYIVFMLASISLILWTNDNSKCEYFVEGDGSIDDYNVVMPSTYYCFNCSNQSPLPNQSITFFVNEIGDPDDIYSSMDLYYIVEI
ncbi:MAG: hypothetical protein ACFFCS_26490, partial [Candidatus Hodarchaeota archaeon]